MSTSRPPQQIVQYDWYPSSSYWYAHSRKQFCKEKGKKGVEIQWAVWHLQKKNKTTSYRVTSGAAQNIFSLLLALKGTQILFIYSFLWPSSGSWISRLFLWPQSQLTLQLWHIPPANSGCSRLTFRLPQEIQMSAEKEMPYVSVEQAQVRDVWTLCCYKLQWLIWTAVTQV